MAPARIALLFLVAVTLVAAPCRDCFGPRAEARQSHDCCPKPVAPPPCHQQPESQCKWAPADPGIAVEKQDGLLEPGPADVFAHAVSALPPALAAPAPSEIRLDLPPPALLASTVIRR